MDIEALRAEKKALLLEFEEVNKSDRPLEQGRQAIRRIAKRVGEIQSLLPRGTGGTVEIFLRSPYYSKN